MKGMQINLMSSNVLNTSVNTVIGSKTEAFLEKYKDEFESVKRADKIAPA